MSNSNHALARRIAVLEAAVFSPDTDIATDTAGEYLPDVQDTPDPPAIDPERSRVITGDWTHQPDPTTEEDSNE